MLATVDTIKVLNDDALKLFKKTLPVTASNIRKKVIDNLQKLSLNDLCVDFLDELKVEEARMMPMRITAPQSSRRVITAKRVGAGKCKCT